MDQHHRSLGSVPPPGSDVRRLSAKARCRRVHLLRHLLTTIVLFPRDSANVVSRRSTRSWTRLGRSSAGAPDRHRIGHRRHRHRNRSVDRRERATTRPHRDPIAGGSPAVAERHRGPNGEGDAAADCSFTFSTSSGTSSTRPLTYRFVPQRGRGASPQPQPRASCSSWVADPRAMHWWWSFSTRPPFLA